MSEKAKLCIVARGARGDQKLPVGRLQQKQFAAKLLHDPGAEFTVAPSAFGAYLAGVELRGIDVRIRPGSLRVQPDLIRTLGPPGALVQRKEARARILLKIARAGGQLKPGRRTMH